MWQRIEVERRRGSRRVDFIFVLRGLESMTGMQSSRVVLDRPGQLPDGVPLWPSDHYGVFAEIEIASKPVMARSFGGPQDGNNAQGDKGEARHDMQMSRRSQIPSLAGLDAQAERIRNPQSSIDSAILKIFGVEEGRSGDQRRFQD